MLLLTFTVLFCEDGAIENKGKVSLVDGKVQKKLMDEEDWEKDVEENSSVFSRESYRTMKKSRAELELKESDVIRLAPKTTIDIVALYEEILEGSETTQVKLEEGDVWAQVNSADEDSEFSLDTDISAAAITGTNFRMTRSKSGKTQMKVYHGEVKIANSKEALRTKSPKSVYQFKEKREVTGPREVMGPKEVTLKEWIYVVKNMQQITFDEKGNVVSAGEFKSNDESEKTDWVEWNKRLDRKRGLK